MIKGVIFDMDGVLVDSEKLYLHFWIEACAKFGFKLSTENALSLRSNSPETATPKFAAWFGDGANYLQIRELRRKLMAKHIDEHGVELKSGAKDLITYLKQNGIKIALATASPEKRAKYYLEPHGIFDKFDAIVCGGAVAHGKPAPDIYIYAAHKLHLPCESCLAVEDSPDGIRSAHGAGCITAMIPDLTEPDEEILSMICHKCKSLNDIRNIIDIQ